MNITEIVDYDLTLAHNIVSIETDGGYSASIKTAELIDHLCEVKTDAEIGIVWQNHSESKTMSISSSEIWKGEMYTYEGFFGLFKPYAIKDMLLSYARADENIKWFPGPLRSLPLAA